MIPLSSSAATNLGVPAFKLYLVLTSLHHFHRLRNKTVVSSLRNNSCVLSLAPDSTLAPPAVFCVITTVAFKTMSPLHLPSDLNLPNPQSPRWEPSCPHSSFQGSTGSERSFLAPSSPPLTLCPLLQPCQPPCCSLKACCCWPGLSPPSPGGAALICLHSWSSPWAGFMAQY